MRRFVLLLLLCVLPLQFALAATADALEHASSGHEHEAVAHVHGLTDDTADTGSRDASSPGHGECGACHFFHTPAMTASGAATPSPANAMTVEARYGAQAFGQTASVRPERPKWVTPV